MHTKILIRTDSFIEHYQHWLQKDVSDIMEMLSGSYANEAFGKGSEDLKIVNTDDFNRILWQPKHLNYQTFGFLMDLFKTKLIAFAGYKTLLSDERSEVFDNGLKFTIHRHSLKHAPDLRYNAKVVADRQFGHLTLEHKFNITTHIFSLTSFNNKSLTTASFEKLMEFLLS